MADYSLPPFGAINTANLEEYYDVDIEFNGKEILLDLNFENEKIDADKLDEVKTFIENLSSFDAKNKTYIDADYNDEEGDTVKFYLEHHLEEVDKGELEAFIDFNNKAIEPTKQLLSKLHLVRVGLFPDSEDIFATFDYSLGEDFTNYLVVINTDKEGNLEYMSMES